MDYLAVFSFQGGGNTDVGWQRLPDRRPTLGNTSAP